MVRGRHLAAGLVPEPPAAGGAGQRAIAFGRDVLEAVCGEAAAVGESVGVADLSEGAGAGSRAEPAQAGEDFSQRVVLRPSEARTEKP